MKRKMGHILHEMFLTITNFLKDHHIGASRGSLSFKRMRGLVSKETAVLRRWGAESSLVYKQS